MKSAFYEWSNSFYKTGKKCFLRVAKLDLQFDLQYKMISFKLECLYYSSYEKLLVYCKM